MTKISDLEQDNESLQQEIELLNRQKTDLLKQIEKIKKKEPSLASFNQLKSLLKANKTRPREKNKQKPEEDESYIANKSKRRRLSHYEEEYPIPEPIVHEFFDQSISKYFEKPILTNSQQKKPLIETDISDIEKTENVLLENIYRMFGITAFPVVDPSANAATSTEMIGIRIEVFNELKLKFETPHYIILSKNPKTGKWIIFKHTIPQYVEIYKWAKHYDDLSDFKLIQFLKTIRDILQKTSYKHQIVDSIKHEMKANIKSIEKDLPLKVLKFKLSFPNLDISTSVILNLSIDSIESCHIDQGFSESEMVRIGDVLKGNIRGFKDRLRDVIRSMV